MNAAKGKFLLIHVVVYVLSLSSVAVSDAVRTSLGPKGMDKMVCSASMSPKLSIRPEANPPRFKQETAKSSSRMMERRF